MHFLRVNTLVQSKPTVGRQLKYGNVAVLGAGEQAKQWLCQLNRRYPAAKCVVGIFDERKTRVSSEVMGYPLLGNLDDLARLVRQGGIHKVVVALPWSAENRLTTIVERLRELPVPVYLAGDLIAYRFAKRERRFWEKATLIELVPAPLSGWGAVLKSLSDKMLAVVLLILFSPIMGLIALAIRIDSHGPILFRQKRFGYNNKVVEVYKFRTMRHDRPSDIDPDIGIVQAVRDDPRVTRTGRLLRRTSLDELPQLVNVLKGEMSMVGPRPHPVGLDKKFEALIGGYHARHKVKPGITGWAQVNGLRGETATTEIMRARIEHDIYYVENWSLLLDIVILVRTAFVAWHQRNAY
jgi:putative colanic acid biosysnthesis UDP-glucose lipid carrier transferase